LFYRTFVKKTPELFSANAFSAYSVLALNAIPMGKESEHFLDRTNEQVEAIHLVQGDVDLIPNETPLIPTRPLSSPRLLV
jgi:hypothetical protein